MYACLYDVWLYVCLAACMHVYGLYVCTYVWLYACMYVCVHIGHDSELDMTQSSRGGVMHARAIGCGAGPGLALRPPACAGGRAALAPAGCTPSKKRRGKQEAALWISQWQAAISSNGRQRPWPLLVDSWKAGPLSATHRLHQKRVSAEAGAYGARSLPARPFARLTANKEASAGRVASTQSDGARVG